ncbi:MAG: hypothetical protein ABI559_10190 [Chloroflexota bacterium]
MNSNSRDSRTWLAPLLAVLAALAIVIVSYALIGGVLPLIIGLIVVVAIGVLGFSRRQ